MNSLKMFLTATMFLIMSIITGCSDTTDPVSFSGVTGNGNLNTEKFKEERDLPIIYPVIPTLRTTIRLKPSRSFTFNYGNTDFVKINSIDVFGVSSGSSTGTAAFNCRDVSISGDTKDDQLLTCHSNGLNVTSITIQNLTSQMLDLDVSLRGVKIKKTSGK